MTLYECYVITFKKVRGELHAVGRRKEIIDDEEGLGKYCPIDGMISIIPIRKAEEAPPHESPVAK